MNKLSVSHVELVRLQRIIESAKRDPREADRAHELIDSWLIDPKRQEVSR
jgi:hypothetical protein